MAAMAAWRRGEKGFRRHFGIVVVVFVGKGVGDNYDYIICRVGFIASGYP